MHNISIRVLFYGHWKVSSYTPEHGILSVLTTDSRLIDRYKSDDLEESDHAAEQIVKLCIDSNSQTPLIVIT